MHMILSFHAYPCLNRAHRNCVFFVSQKSYHPLFGALLLAPMGICLVPHYSLLLFIGKICPEILFIHHNGDNQLTGVDVITCMLNDKCVDVSHLSSLLPALPESANHGRLLCREKCHVPRAPFQLYLRESRRTWVSLLQLSQSLSPSGLLAHGRQYICHKHRAFVLSVVRTSPIHSIQLSQATAWMLLLTL